MTLLHTLLDIANVSDPRYMERLNAARNAWMKQHGSDVGFEEAWQQDEIRRLNQLERWREAADEVRREMRMGSREQMIEDEDNRQRAEDINTERRLLGL